MCVGNYTILFKGLENLWSWVFGGGVLEPILPTPHPHSGY